MEEPREQCTVVFALIVTQPAGESVCVWGGEGMATPHLPLTGSVTISAKTTVHCSPDSAMLNLLNVKLLKSVISHECRLFDIQVGNLVLLV